MANPKLSGSFVRPANQSGLRSESGPIALEFDDPVELDIASQVQLPNSPDTGVHVRIRRMRTGFFEIFSQAKFVPQSLVQLLFRGELVNGQVLYCRSHASGWNIGIQTVAPQALRRELRFPVDYPGQLTLSGSETPIKVRVVDTSKSGLGLAAPVELPVGATVAVEFSKGTVFGEIRHCIPVSGYFRAGLAAL